MAHLDLDRVRDVGIAALARQTRVRHDDVDAALNQAVQRRIVRVVNVLGVSLETGK